jgi:sugar phosphate isomerase/epimerase
MKLALMTGDLVPADELQSLGFHAVQMFWGHGPDGGKDDMSAAEIGAKLDAGGMALAAMTLHIDLVNGQGAVANEIARTQHCVELTAALADRFGDNERPILVWHPSGYPEGDDVDDAAVFGGLCEALSAVCTTAAAAGVDIAVEITRAGSIGGAESYLRVRDQVQSAALRVCLDAANFVPDRTPLERAVRMLGAEVAIAHGKDAHFAANGEVADYGPIGTGKLDYDAYISALKAYASPAYFVLEYYRDRPQLLHARDVVQALL